MEMWLLVATSAVLTAIPLLTVIFFVAFVLRQKQKSLLAYLESVRFADSLPTDKKHEDSTDVAESEDNRTAVERRNRKTHEFIREEFNQSFGRVNLYFPCGLLTALYIIAFIHATLYIAETCGFYASDLLPDKYSHKLLPALLAFAGAYLFNLGNLVRRIYLADIRHTVYWACVNRTVLATGLGALLGAVSDWDTSGEWLVAYFGIGFLANVYLANILKAGLQTAGMGDPSMVQTSRLTMITGINFWQESRLEEEGIDSVQALATANPVGLAVSTRYNLITLVDWIDQAILLQALGDKVKPLKDVALISGAIDFAWASPLSLDGDTAIADEVAGKLGGIEPAFVRLLMDNLYEDVRVQTLYSLWQTEFEP